MAVFNAHALIIGIATYAALPVLSSSDLDGARAITDVLIDPQACGYPAANVSCLLDTQATHDAILEALRALGNRTDDDSTALIYFSGYGVHAAQSPLAENYLMPVDALWKSNEQAFGMAIRGDEFAAVLRSIPARKLTVVLDCCHPVNDVQTNVALPMLQAGLSKEYYAELQQGSGGAILASWVEGEPSWIAPDVPRGAFTRYLLDALRGAAGGSDGYIHILDFFSYIQTHLKEAQSRQSALLKSEAEDNFVIALARGGAKQEPLPDSQGYRYDAYLCFADAETDRQVLEHKVIPRLRDAGLRLAVWHEVNEIGAFQIVEVERVVEESKYTVMFMSPAYFEDPIAEFANVLVQTLELSERRIRLKAVLFAPMGDKKIPSRLRVYVSRDLTRPERFESEMERLIEGLKRPLPG